VAPLTASLPCGVPQREETQKSKDRPMIAINTKLAGILATCLRGRRADAGRRVSCRQCR
jgi:hypothetical protein